MAFAADSNKVLIKPVICNENWASGKNISISLGKNSDGSTLGYSVSHSAGKGTNIGSNSGTSSSSTGTSINGTGGTGSNQGSNTSVNSGSNVSSGSSIGTSGSSSNICDREQLNKNKDEISYNSHLLNFQHNKDTKNNFVLLGIDNQIVIGNNVNLVLDAVPYMQDGNTMVPVRAISEGLKSQIKWDGKTQKVTVIDGSNKIILTIGSKVANVNGKNVTMPAKAEINEGTTFIPLRFIAENLKATVEWDADSQVVILTKAK